jgi:serine/threonine protein kinase
MESGIMLGHYEITSAIGKGGMGEVRKAKDTKLGREVALEFLTKGLSRDGHDVKRFELEACASSAVGFCLGEPGQP